MTNQRTLLLSLRPRFAAAILAGTKVIEIRRRPVNAVPGTPIILYASSPQMAVVGTARLGEVTVCLPGDGWRRFHEDLGVSREEYDAYLDGAANAHLLHIRAVNRLNEPLPLRHLREQAPFQPPQSFRYVAAGDPAGLRDLVKA
ncbi:ASCH domain-containing protein [Actinoplanes sp. HUAS TT8]|uniref:ASCH domain-containing protein n=1 Tax=Actinoplanes sp. HUAS TT8 TaxID=3447453 RepID=UPI003F523A50